MVRKIQLCATIIVLCFLLSFKVLANEIDNVIGANPQVHSAIIGISVKDNSGNILYQKNAQTLIHPASTLKLITSSAAYNYLGENYQFKTALYRNGKNVYLKVGADPLFTYDDMLNLVSQYKNKNQEIIRNLIIDDTIIDKISYGTGWQWDDNTNIHFPQMSPYIINHNLFMIKANLTNRNAIAIEYANEYKEPVINRLNYSENTDFTVERNIFTSNAPVVLDGVINGTQVVAIPARNPEQLYYNVLLFAFLNNNIPLNTQFKYDKVPLFSSQEAIITHNINDILKSINQNSDNLAAEVLIKHAGAVKTESTGTTKDGLAIVKDYYQTNGLSCSNIHIADASGASMNDYVTADFMTSALNIISKSNDFNIIKNSMTDNNVGTFKGRLPELNGKLKVKTGTNANTSGVVGYLETKSGKKINFAVMLDNIPNEINTKEFENKIIKAIYNEF